MPADDDSGRSDDEAPQMRAVALQNAAAILAAQRRAESMLVEANTALEAKSAELERSTRILALLNRTGNMLAAQLELPALLQSTVDATTELCGASFGALLYASTDSDALEVYGCGPLPADAVEALRPVAASALAGRMSRWAPTRIDDLEAEIAADIADLAPRWTHVRSYLGVAVALRSGRVVGLLAFGHPRPASITDLGERLVVGVAAQASVAIDNARLFASERHAREAAERSGLLKDEFLATLSHELRTPLNAIVGWTQLLQSNKAVIDRALLDKGLSTIERNAQAQSRLIEDLLDMNRIASGKVRLDARRISPLGFVEAAVETARPSATAKGVDLEIRLDRTVGEILGDPHRLQQVLWNLLLNAIKFTPRDGRVTVELRHDGAHVEIDVIDTGVGIEPEFLPHVFERFRQADGTATRSHGGLGLGLAIVRGLVELHGGRVAATSAGVDRGATFTVRLPLLQQESRDAPIRRPASDSSADRASAALPGFAPAELAGISVLVVDDHDDAREIAREVLEACGASVAVAASADEALEHFRAARPDVLVSDIGMPGVDGYELLRRIRVLELRIGGKVPAIALTAFARPEDRARAVTVGYAVHLVKPVDSSELAACVATLAGRGDDRPT